MLLIISLQVHIVQHGAHAEYSFSVSGHILTDLYKLVAANLYKCSAAA